MKEINIIEDVSKLTTIPEVALNKICEKIEWCICDSVQEMKMAKEDNIILNIGIGKIEIIDEDDVIRYRFIPSTNLESSVKETILNHQNPIQINTEKMLKNKILNTYKDIYY